VTARSLRDGYELGNKGTGCQLVCDLSFGSIDKLDIIQTN